MGSLPEIQWSAAVWCDPPGTLDRKQAVKQIKEGFNNYTTPRQLIRKPQILLQIRNSSQRSNAQDQTLNELNRFYLECIKGSLI